MRISYLRKYFDIDFIRFPALSAEEQVLAILKDFYEKIGFSDEVTTRCKPGIKLIKQPDDGSRSGWCDGIQGFSECFSIATSSKKSKGI